MNEEELWDDCVWEKPHALLDEEDNFDDSCDYGYESREI